MFKNQRNLTQKTGIHIRLLQDTVCIFSGARYLTREFRYCHTFLLQYFFDAITNVHKRKDVKPFCITSAERSGQAKDKKNTNRTSHPTYMKYLWAEALRQHDTDRAESQRLSFVF